MEEQTQRKDFMYDVIYFEDYQIETNRVEMHNKKVRIRRIWFVTINLLFFVALLLIEVCFSPANQPLHPGSFLVKMLWGLAGLCFWISEKMSYMELAEGCNVMAFLNQGKLIQITTVHNDRKNTSLKFAIDIDNVVETTVFKFENIVRTDIQNPVVNIKCMELQIPYNSGC